MEERMFATLPAWTEPQRTLREKLGYLFALGHFLEYEPSLAPEAWDKVLRDVNSEGHSAFIEATESLQQFGFDVRGTPLKVDGVYGFFTKGSHAGRFCGCPDRTPNFDCLRQQFGGGQPKWVGGPIAVGGSLNVGQANAQSHFAAAQWWQTACGIPLVHAATKAEADVWADSARIDGASNTLAWSYTPDNNQKVRSAGGRRQLAQRFDTADASTYRDAQSAKEIMGHELGHAFHFDGHTNNRNDVMFPSFSGPKYRFGENEIRLIVQAYGQPGDVPDEPDPGDPGLPPTPPTGAPGPLHLTLIHGGRNWRYSGGTWTPIGG